VSFTETDPNPNVNNDRIEIDFSTDPSDFSDPVYEAATTQHVYTTGNPAQFIVSATAGVTKILFNNTNNFWFIWNHGPIQGFMNFTHVSLHELGHIIGLHHCTAGGYPVMIETFNLNHSSHPRLYLQTPDQQGLQKLCNHVTGIEDYIWVYVNNPTDPFNVNQI
jgi:hypothetical protein